jgi:ribosomal-protein-alanine N-acetyltransferase
LTQGSAIQIVRPDEADVDVLADLHACSFEAGWDSRAMLGFLQAPACIALAARAADDDRICGFVIARFAGDEAEIITLLVAPVARRRGIGEALMTELLNELSKHGIGDLFLEVSESNQAATALYRKLGFANAGRRKRYYRNQTSSLPEDALILRCALGRDQPA